MMRSLTFCFVALLAHLGAASFDCRRTSQSCTAPTTCAFTSSTCDCSSATSPSEGYDCGLVTAQIRAGACATSDPCSTHGTCYDSAGTALCYCTADSYGTNCDEKRLTVACETGKMVIGVNPAGASFTGHAYVQGYRADANCNLAQVPDPTLASDSIPDTWMGYALDLDNTGTACGDVVAVNTGGKTEYTRIIVVQYESDFLTSIDDLFTAKCVFNHAGALVFSGIAKLDPTALTGNLNEISAETEFSPVSLALTSGGSPVVSTTPINVGSEIVFTFTIPTEYESMRIVTAVADNTVTADLKTLNIVTASCMDNAAYPISVEAPTRGSTGTDKREITLKLKAFHFDGNDEVGFKFTVKVCLTANDADCNPETCNGVAASGFGRKKREASAGEKVITRFITVRDPQSFGQDGQTGLTNSNCQITGQTTAAMVAMGIVIFTLLILCLVLIVRFVSHRNRSESKQDLHA
ncbi:EGF-like domain-containing protein 2 [Haliotis rubra]|uniref:EGF-like domain-containing protein 2 n=1 Tax=Haliotis rubra TaxID=36100 RepID=UPI001EE5FB93|nr:EGF-like domain-containing protein 2 [Haliotis rubra]